MANVHYTCLKHSSTTVYPLIVATSHVIYNNVTW